MKKLFLGLVVLGLLISACTPPTPPGIGVTGGVVTTPNNSAALTIPANTFTAPVNIKLEPIVAPPLPLEYTPLGGGSFQITAPNEFVANQDVTLEIEDSGLTSASGGRFTLQAIPAGSLLVTLARRPADTEYLMYPTKRVSSKWVTEISKEYFCYVCKYLVVLFTPTSISINIANVPEEAAVQATMSAKNSKGEQVTPSVTWSVLNTNVATVNATTGLVTGINQGTTELSAFYSATVNAKTTLQVTAKPVLFAANYNAGLIKGYRKGQLAVSGSPSPIVTITLPANAKPNDLAFDPSGNLWATNNTGNQLLGYTPNQFNQTGNPTPSVVIDTDAQNSLSSPLGLNFDSSGNLWVSNSNSLVRFPASALTSSGVKTPDRKITQGLSFPAGLAIDSSGNLWVANFMGNNVLRFTPPEQQNNSAASYVLSQNLVKPVGLEFDSSGNLYVGQEGAPSGISVFTAAQLTTPNPSATRFIGLGATNKIYGLAKDNSTGTIWANNQGDGAAIAYTAAQLAQTPAATTPSVSIGGATESNIGYGGVAFANGGAAPAPKPSINSFAVNKENLPVGGGNVTLSWNVTGATSLSINQGVGVVTGSSTSRTVAATTSFILTATNANGSVDSSLVTVNVATNALPKLWHASLRENIIRGYSQAKWGGANAGIAPDTTLNLVACGNVLPNDLIQDNAGNIIFSAPGVQKVIRIAAAVVSQNGVVNVTAGQCETLFSGINEFIGLTLDTDGRSFFVGTQSGLRYLKYNAGTNSYANQVLPILNLNVAVSGVHLAANRLYAVEYVDFNGSTNGKVRVYDLDPNRINDATLRLTFQPNGNNFRLPEGISIAAGKLWVANNSGDNLMGFKLTDINATPVNNQVQQLSFISKNNSNGSSFMHCPGGIATAPNGELWVNIQGASAANANCGNFGTALGNIYKYSAADLADASSPTAAPGLQFSGIVSVPGYGGLFFGK